MLQFCERIHARRHRDRPRVDGSRTLNISRSIADHAGGAIRHFALEVPAHGPDRHTCDVVAVSVLIPKAAGFKKVIDSKVAQLDPCSFDIVAGEQAQMHGLIAMQLVKQCRNTRQQFTRQSLQTLRQSIQIAPHESFAFLRSVHERVSRKNLIGDPAIRATCREDAFEGKPNAEFFDERKFHGALSSSAGAEHRAIDIKE